MCVLSPGEAPPHPFTHPPSHLLHHHPPATHPPKVTPHPPIHLPIKLFKCSASFRLMPLLSFPFLFLILLRLYLSSTLSYSFSLPPLSFILISQLSASPPPCYSFYLPSLSLILIRHLSTSHPPQVIHFLFPHFHLFSLGNSLPLIHLKLFILPSFTFILHLFSYFSLALIHFKLFIFSSFTFTYSHLCPLYHSSTSSYSFSLPSLSFTLCLFSLVCIAPLTHITFSSSSIHPLITSCTL